MKRRMTDGIVIVIMWNLKSLLFLRTGISANVDLKRRVTQVDSVTKHSKHSEHIVRNEILEEGGSPNQVDYPDMILLLEQSQEDIGNENALLERIKEGDWIPDEFDN